MDFNKTEKKNKIYAKAQKAYDRKKHIHVSKLHCFKQKGETKSINFLYK